MSPFEVLLIVLIPLVEISVSAAIGWSVAKLCSNADDRRWAARFQQ